MALSKVRWGCVCVVVREECLGWGKEFGLTDTQIYRHTLTQPLHHVLSNPRVQSYLLLSPTGTLSLIPTYHILQTLHCALTIIPPHLGTHLFSVKQWSRNSLCYNTVWEPWELLRCIHCHRTVSINPQAIISGALGVVAAQQARRALVLTTGILSIITAVLAFIGLILAFLTATALTLYGIIVSRWIYVYLN